jgi:hypothetical protein
MRLLFSATSTKSEESAVIWLSQCLSSKPRKRMWSEVTAPRFGRFTLSMHCIRNWADRRTGNVMVVEKIPASVGNRSQFV